MFFTLFTLIQYRVMYVYLNEVFMYGIIPLCGHSVRRSNAENRVRKGFMGYRAAAR